MALFSERYGYIKPNEVIIREQITEPIQNSIYNWILKIFGNVDQLYIETEVWLYFLNNKINEYQRYRSYSRDGVILNYIDNNDNKWYKKLDLIEFILPYIENSMLPIRYGELINVLNSEFERLNFAYRIINGRFEEITSKKEIESIEEALTNTVDGVRTHLQTALEKLSASQKEPDYRNSIKESISAVECLCRTITGKKDFGDALIELERNGVFFNKAFKIGLEKLYAYTCNPDTGIRHALLEDTNAPTGGEAIFMLVLCSAFINYITKKTSLDYER